LTTQVASFELPIDLVEALNEFAIEQHASPDKLVADALRLSLSPFRREAIRRLNAEIAKQAEEKPDCLEKHRAVWLPAPEQERLDDLLEANRKRVLTEGEQHELQRLYDRIEAIATEKAAAIHLQNMKAHAPDRAR